MGVAAIGPRVNSWELQTAPIPMRMPGLAPAAAVRRFSAFGTTYFAELEKYAMAPPESATKVVPLRNGRQAHAARLALINGATSSIVMTTYAIVHDPYGIEIV